MAVEAAPAIPVPTDDAIERAAAFTREPFLLDGEVGRGGARARLGAPPCARRRAGRAGGGREGPVGRLAPALVAPARPGPAAERGRAEARRRHGALRPPGRRAVGHAHRAARRGGQRRGRTARRPTPSRPPRSPRPAIPGEEELDDEDEPEEPQDWEDEAAADADEEEQLPEAPEDPNAAKRFWFEHATGAGKTVAALGFVEGSRTGGTLILTHRRNLVDQFLGELRDRGYAKRIAPPLVRGQDRADGPVTVETYQWFVRNAGQRLRRVHDRHLRRGAHRAGREDVGVDPQLARAGVRRHDRHGRADRPPRHRPVPDADLALRPRAGRAARRHLPAALRPHPAGARRAHDRQGAAAPRRGRHRVRPGDAGRAARPAAVQPGGRRPLQDALQRRPRRRLLRGRAPRLQRRGGVPRRRDEGPGGVGRDAEARAGRDPRPLRARRHRRARQRPAARRGLELAARHGLHAPRADRVQAHLPAARRPRHAPASRQGGRHRRRLRPSRDEARRPGRHAALAARPRGLPRRRDRGRPGAPRPRARGCASSAACCP